MKLVKSIDEYKKIEKENYADITVIRNGNISEAKINEYKKNHIRNTERIIVNHIVFISKGIDFLQCSIEKVYSGYENGYISDYTSKQLSGKIIVIGLFCDFSAAMDRKIKLLCKETASISYIIGEDIASLSYQLMKQGFRSDSKKNLVVFGNLLSASEIRFAKKLEQYGFDVITQIAHFISSKDNPQGPLFKDHIYIADPFIEPDVKKILIENVLKIAVASNYNTGATHIEMRINQKGCYVIESACRPGGGGALYKVFSDAYDVNVFKLFIGLFIKDNVETKVDYSPKKLSMLYIVPQTEKGIIKEIQGLQEIIDLKEMEYYFLDLKSMRQLRRQS